MSARRMTFKRLAGILTATVGLALVVAIRAEAAAREECTEYFACEECGPCNYTCGVIVAYVNQWCCGQWSSCATSYCSAGDGGFNTLCGGCGPEGQCHCDEAGNNCENLSDDNPKSKDY